MRSRPWTCTAPLWILTLTGWWRGYNASWCRGWASSCQAHCWLYRLTSLYFGARSHLAAHFGSIFRGDSAHSKLKVAKRNPVCSQPASYLTRASQPSPPSHPPPPVLVHSASNAASRNSVSPPPDLHDTAASVACICKHLHLNLAYVLWNKYH